MIDEIYDVEVTTNTPSGARTEHLPCYTCGHCSSVIMLRNVDTPGGPRLRERVRCLGCGRLICEKNEICNTHCTPIHRLAADGALNDPKWGQFVPAIMAGVTGLEEAVSKGLINKKE